MNDLSKFIDKEKRIFLFLGEAGSGKSEIAINFALEMAKERKKVVFFDMDQTKPIFRSREAKEILEGKNVKLKNLSGLLDAPVVPHGVIAALEDVNTYTVLDIGGDVNGARMIGQFSNAWTKNLEAYYVINYYRNISGNINKTIDNIQIITQAARINEISILSNSNLGDYTDIEDIVKGHRELLEAFKDTKYYFKLIVSLSKYKEKLKEIFPSEYVFGINRYIKGTWEQ